MSKASIAFVFITCIWLGSAIGANLVAAPAKFTVKTLTTADLVSVGRAQFRFVGYVERHCQLKSIIPEVPPDTRF